MSLSRPRRLVPAGCILVLVGLVGLVASGCSPRRPPLILITIDTLRADHVGPRGSLPSLTPGLDTVAEDGVVYDDATANSTMTLPSHLAMLTGLHPPRHAAKARRYMLEDGIATLPEVLRDHGYKTGAVVSSRVVTKRLTGLADVFDLYDQSFSRPERNRPHLLTKPPEEAVRIAGDWIETHSDDPFFLWLHIFPPHGPYDPPARFLDDVALDADSASPQTLPTGDRNYVPGWIPKYQHLGSERDAAVYRRRYAAHVRYADHHLGRLFERLRDVGVYEKALIAITADHGESLGEHGWYFCHGNLVYQEQAHVPLIVKLPGNARAGSLVRAPVELVDLMPTLLEAARVQAPEGLDGRVLPLPGDSPVHRERFVQSEGAELMALMDGPWKLALRRPTAHLVPQDHPRRELFRLDLDPDEAVNLVRQEPQRARRMRERLLREFRGASARQTATDDSSDHDTQEMLRALGYLD